jgi:hypothetical protein
LEKGTKATETLQQQLGAPVAFLFEALIIEAISCSEAL